MRPKQQDCDKTPKYVKLVPEMGKCGSSVASQTQQMSSIRQYKQDLLKSQIMLKTNLKHITI